MFFYFIRFHGCNKCFGDNTFNPVLRTMNSTLKKRTDKKIARIKTLYPNFDVIEMYEHDWDKLCRESSDIINWLKDYKFNDSLCPRASLYGGRTNALVLFYECKKGEKIFYYDFCSLYPAVMKYGVYPLGHPKIISENFDYTKKYFGIIKCKILPPQDLYLPVLPLNINNKLVFTLCYTCALNQENNFDCMHQASERALEGTWCSLEIDKALEKGYKLIEYQQVWEFVEKSEYDPTNKKGGLFTEYINANLKGKVEASGFPNHCKTEDDKTEFIKAYFEKEGIILDRSNIIINSGARAGFKEKLNSLWGFFALGSNKTLFKIIYKRSELDNLLNDDQFIIENIDFGDGDSEFIQVSYSQKEEFSFGSNKTNVIIASFVTTQARLKLYDELEKLGRNVLYFDTGKLKTFVK